MTIDHFYYLALTLLCAIPLGLYMIYNEDSQKLERFYYENDRQKYEILKITLFVLTTAMILNSRFIASEVCDVIYKRIGLS